MISKLKSEDSTVLPKFTDFSKMRQETMVDATRDSTIAEQDDQPDQPLNFKINKYKTKILEYYYVKK